MARAFIGNFKGPKGDKGDAGTQGKQGNTGATGQRGSRWSEGTAITGTSTTATVFSGTGITDALANDMYMNTSSGNVYRCTTSGAADTAKWVFVGNIKGVKGDKGNKGDKGEKGDKGDKGETGATGATGASGTADTTFTEASTLTKLTSGESFKTMLGKIAKAVSTVFNKLDKSSVVNNNTTTQAGFALDARQANPNIEGTMAANILQLNNDFQNAVPWIQDCSIVNSHLAYASPDTLHTPAAEGKTNSTISIILTVIVPMTTENVSINTQYSFTAVTGEIFVRTITGGIISEWRLI